MPRKSKTDSAAAARDRSSGWLLRQLQAAIAARGLSLYELAKQTGIPYMVLHRLATGQTDPRLSTVEKVAAALGVEFTGPT